MPNLVHAPIGFDEQLIIDALANIESQRVFLFLAGRDSKGEMRDLSLAQLAEIAFTAMCTADPIKYLGVPPERNLLTALIPGAVRPPLVYTPLTMWDKPSPSASGSKSVEAHPPTTNAAPLTHNPAPILKPQVGESTRKKGVRGPGPDIYDGVSQFLTLRMLVHITGKNEKTIRRHITNGTLDTDIDKDGGAIKIRKAAAEAYLKKRGFQLPLPPS